jgi:uncharacterized protein YodC (DUF2158 family)
MKRLLLILVFAVCTSIAVAQLSTTAFTKQCEAMGLQFYPTKIQNDFKPLQLDSTLAKQFDYAVISNDGKMEYRYRLISTVKDSAKAAFMTQYLFYEAVKIKAGYPAITIKPYAKETVKKAYNGDGGYSAAFKPGDALSSNFASCSCFSFYKEGKGMFIVYMLTNDNKILTEGNYAAGLVGLLSFK